jgi:hypothetical protein
MQMWVRVGAVRARLLDIPRCPFGVTTSRRVLHQYGIFHSKPVVCAGTCDITHLSEEYNKNLMEIQRNTPLVKFSDANGSFERLELAETKTSLPTFRGIQLEERHVSDQIALVLPTSICSAQIANLIAADLNKVKPPGVSRFVALPHTEGSHSFVRLRMVDGYTPRQKLSPACS